MAQKPSSVLEACQRDYDTVVPMLETLKEQHPDLEHVEDWGNSKDPTIRSAMEIVQRLRNNLAFLQNDIDAETMVDSFSLMVQAAYIEVRTGIICLCALQPISDVLNTALKEARKIAEVSVNIGVDFTPVIQDIQNKLWHIIALKESPRIPIAVQTAFSPEIEFYPQHIKAEHVSRMAMLEYQKTMRIEKPKEPAAPKAKSSVIGGLLQGVFGKK